MKKKVFVRNAITLTACSLFLSGLGMVSRIYQSNQIGAEGMGLLQLLLSVYYLATNLAVSGINLAVTRLISEALADNQACAVKGILKKSFFLCLLLGIGSGILLFVFAPALGTGWLNDNRTVDSLRILAVGLPFLSVSACMRGYFLAIRDSFHPSSGQILEQLISFLFVAVFVPLFAPHGLSAACCGVALGITAGEIFGNLYLILFFRRQTRTLPKKRNRRPVLFRQITAISLPIALGYYLRSALASVENVLIPSGLKQFGTSYEASLADYGTVKGMVLPVLFFPQAFLAAFSQLLIPEVSEARTVDRPAEIRSIASRVFQLCLLFSFFVTGIFFFLGPELGLLLYNDVHAGNQMRLLCPLIPFLYLDSIVDAILKGMDEQMYSLKVNLSDSCLRILCILICVPRLGIVGFLLATCLSALYNSSLSIGRVVKKVHLRFSIFHQLLFPILCSLLGCTGGKAIASLLGISSFPILFLCVAVVLSLGFYFILLYLSRCVSKQDLSALLRFFPFFKRKRPA